MDTQKTGKILVMSKRAKVPADAVVVDCTSRSKEAWSRKFSPFFLGPIDVTPFEETFQAKTMENAWQYTKVYPNYEDKEKYLEWAKKGFNAAKAERYPMGRGKKPLYAVWKGEKLGYVEARKKIYAPIYSECVERYASDSLDKLRELFNEGKTIALLDFDGYAKYTDLKTVLNDPKKKMGHAFVLAMMILNKRHWQG